MKRKVFTLALAICVLAVMACGSLAYFSATHSATNKFMTAKYDPEDPSNPPSGDDLFSIVITETVPGSDGSSTTTSGNTYKDVLPGDKIVKDPTISNTGAYSQWVRATVSISNAANWLDALGLDKAKAADCAALFDKLVTKGYNKDLWTRVNPTAIVNDTLTYVFYLKAALPAEDDVSTTTIKENEVCLFTEVTIPSSLTKEQFAKLCTFNMTVKADAIQSQNTASNCVDSFKSPYWSEN